MLAPEHGVCSGFWRVYACKVIPSVMTPSETALPCRTPGPPATSRGCYQRCHLGFLLRQAGWQGALAHCQPWQSAVLCQLCLHSPHRSVLAAQNGLSQQQPPKPALGTKLPLSARRFALLITCSWTSRAVLKLHTPASRPCPVLLALFHSPGHINIDFLHSLSLNVFFYLPGGNFALVASKVDPN